MLKYGVGQVGAQIFRDVPATLLPLFFATILGVPPWMGGVAILIPKIWIVVCDPLVGAISDREKASWGRMPFLLIGGLTTSLGFLALFVTPSFQDPLLSAIYVGAVFTVASTAFSVFSVPYLALASEMSEDYHERTKIMTFRVTFIPIGLIIGLGLAQPMIKWFGDGRHGWALMASVLTAIIFGSMMACYLGMRNIPLNTTIDQDVPLLTQFRIAARNRPFLILVSAHFIQQLGQAASYSAVALMFIYVIQDVTLILPFITLMSFTALIIQPLWMVFSRHAGKRRTYFISAIGWMLVTASWFLARPSDDVLVTLPFAGALSTQQALVLVRGVIIGVFNSGFILMSLSILTDTIDYDRRQHHVSREGIYSGVYSALEKLAFAAGPAIGGIVLSTSGFEASTMGPIAQSSAALRGIVIVYALLPITFTLAGLTVLSRYHLNQASLEALGP